MNYVSALLCSLVAVSSTYIRSLDCLFAVADELSKAATFGASGTNIAKVELQPGSRSNHTSAAPVGG